MIHSKIIYRESYTVNEGTMGFNDYITRYQNFEDFVKIVREELNKLDLNPEIDLISVSYPNEKIAIIFYKSTNYE